tara:strand:- start:789 stop:2255 length:1467 start_codon:yes stop_codon:yes gene_type:complete
VRVAPIARIPAAVNTVAAKTTKYSATAESLSSHEAPEWFRDAKFGIFIHWGPYSIPAFAPKHSQIDELDASDERHGFANTPYAAWYQNTMLFEESPTAAYHRETFGDDYSYDHFGQAFNDALEAWDPVSWARLFKSSGARYVVLVTKHHDGFALWPSDVPNPNKPGWHTTRDVVGELAAAVRAEGLKFGVYYSGGVDWTFKHKRIESFVDFMTSMPGDAEGYSAYANAQYEELIERYQPDYLWNDIAYPHAQDSFDIIAKYYNTVPDGLTNDRWITPDGQLPEGAFDKPEGLTGLLPPMPQVWDTRTPEYGMFDRILPFLWESTRGMGHSFAYNRNETDEDYISRDGIVAMLARSACFNGNVLLNVGPRGDTIIPPGQASRLEAVGEWLGVAGVAVQDTRSVQLAERDVDGIAIGATQNGSNLYIHLFGVPTGKSITVELPDGVSDVIAARQLGGDLTEWSVDDGKLTATVPAWADSAVQVLALELPA